MSAGMSFQRRSDAGRPGALGQAVVEFALVLVLLTTLLLSVFDLGRIVFVQNAIIEGAREAARVGAVGATLTVAKYTAIRNAAIAQAFAADVQAGDITGDSPACEAPGEEDDVSPTTCFYPDGATGSTVVVNITVTVSTFMPIGPVTLTARSVGRIQSSAWHAAPVARVVAIFDRGNL